MFLKLKASPSTMKLELFLEQDLLNMADDKKGISKLSKRVTFVFQPGFFHVTQLFGPLT